MKTRFKPVALALAAALLLTLAGPAAALDAAGASVTAYASSQTVTVDGAAVDFAMYARKDENGWLTNYVRIRDLAAALAGTPARFDVGYDGAVSLTAGADYQGPADSAAPFAGDRPCTVPAEAALVNGAPAALDAIRLTDDAGGGHTYYKLRDLGRALGFYVGWSAETGVTVETALPYFDAVDYADSANWAYYEAEMEGKAADVFFVCPTVYGGGESGHNMVLTDTETKAAFLGATNMEKGIYDDDARFFAPYYRQVGLSVYMMDEADRAPYLNAAYADVKAAFSAYMERENNGRGVVLAGFSQGGDLCLRLAGDFFGEDASQLVACYAIGWRVSEDELARHPALSLAAGADDAGVIVSFNSEAPAVESSLCVPAGTKTLAVNPLNWTSDETKADKSLNKGACFTDYEGNIVTEAPQLTGAYLDPVRGTLKVPDVSAEDYPAVLSIFSEGEYHLYDYQFFYRNLEENVQARIAAWQGR